MTSAHTFKNLHIVPTGNDLVEIVLSKTQRKTPTVVHARFPIVRIRQFYMRKVKFAQQTIHDRFSQIISDFPRLDDIHPFYADLINILYDRDHYKLALGQISGSLHIVDKLAKDFVKLLKFADTLYRCKMLKRASLGRMATVLKKNNPSLQYLEQVRQHLSRLPSIDTSTRTIILCGYPNVGKSSFINKLTRADVDVQPYPFTTKSLFVGHMDYKYLRWQLIDTPGILDHPLPERNTIEMQAITALAHLRCAVLFFIDISGSSGYTVTQQYNLFQDIKPLFKDKIVVFIANKIDLLPLNNLDQEDTELLQSLKSFPNSILLSMSNVTEEGIIQVRDAACDALLAQRVEVKTQIRSGNSLQSRISITLPKPRDDHERPVSIPASVIAMKKMIKDGSYIKPKKILSKDREKEAGGVGMFSFDLSEHFLLDNPEWNKDKMPEIIDGMNIADYIDSEILNKLNELEKEEEILDNEVSNKMEDNADIELDADDEHLLKSIRDKKTLMKKESRLNKSRNYSRIPRTKKKVAFRDLQDRLDSIGLDTRQASHMRSRSRTIERSRKRQRSQTVQPMETDDRSKSRFKSRNRSMPPNKIPRTEGFGDVKIQALALKKSHKAQVKSNRQAKKGESDRQIPTKKPKHLFSGKRGIGSADRR